MSYAGDRLIRDADSHLMEMPDFLSAHADSATRPLLPSLDGITSNTMFDPGALAGRRGHAPERVEALLALGDTITRGPKWHAALGAFNGAERALALDLLGFAAQVVFSSFCARAIFEAPPPSRYPASRAHNRGMAAFCCADRRLLGAAMVPLDEPDLALEEIERAADLGLRAVWVSAAAPGGRSPGHPAHDRIWATLAERRMPFILHVGSSPLSIDAPFTNDGHAEARPAGGQAEVISAKDLTVIHHGAQRFLSALVLDGVLDRFPDLRGGVIEIGAGWAPDMIRRLDHAVDIWARSEPRLGRMKRKPSEQIRQQLRFTPYPFEDVAALVRESYPELYLFSSDYPHAEGGRDPIGRFDRSTATLSDEIRAGFFAGNFLDLFPGAA
jgi:predicted TIM-barrel fold metal-dependent hydrolase